MRVFKTGLCAGLWQIAYRVTPILSLCKHALKFFFHTLCWFGHTVKQLIDGLELVEIT